jgi:hypothetical protein
VLFLSKMSQINYKDLPPNMSSTMLFELRAKIKNCFLEEKLLKILGTFIRKNETSKPFTFVDFTIHNLVDLLHPLYMKLEKRELLRFILLIMLGNDALPQKADEPRYHNTKVLLNGVGPLKDELIKDIKSKFEDVECTYPIIADPRRGKNYTNYALVVYYGKSATKLRADLADKKAKKVEKQKAKRAKASEESEKEETLSVDSSEANSEIEAENPEKSDEAKSATYGAGSCAIEPEVRKTERSMEERITDFASKKGNELSASILEFTINIAFKQQIENGIKPDWENYGKLFSMINDVVAHYASYHPECLPA